MNRTDLLGVSGDGSLRNHCRVRVTDLPVEILINILQYCQGADILNIAEAFTGSKLDSVIKDPSLWRRAVIGPGDIKKYIKFLGKYTSSLTIIGSNSKPRPKQSEGPVLAESVISSIRLRCSELEEFTIKHCIIDNHAVRFSLFPKSITYLTLDAVTFINGSTMKSALRSSPFHCIKKSLPKLKHLTLLDPSSYLTSWDSIALVNGCESPPSLRIEGEDHHYSFDEDTGREDASRLTRGKRKDTKKLFGDLVMYHYIKKRYNTRQEMPS